MAKFVGQNRDAEFACGLLDGALDIGLMHPKTHECARARITAEVVGGKEPGPSPGELVFRIFVGQPVRQRHRDMVLPVGVPHLLGSLPLPDQFLGQRRGQCYHPIPPALGSTNAEAGSFKVDVFDPQIDRFGHAQPAAVEQAGEQVGGIAKEVTNAPE